MRKGISSSISLGFLLGLGVVLGIGCASAIHAPTHYDFFSSPDANDAWSPKIAGWQRRERAEVDLEVQRAVDVEAAENPRVAAETERGVRLDSAVENTPGLREKYLRYRAQRRRQLAREFTEWIQSQSKIHYVADGPIDHWATLEETLRSNGDDCDGLELLTFNALRDLGLADNEVYRAVVYRSSDGQHHMVTLWFEDRQDPWVIDPTGAMTKGMPRMSQLSDWVPLKIFGEVEEYTARRVIPVDGVPELASNP